MRSVIRASRSATVSPSERGAAGGHSTLTLLVRAYCHLCDEMRAAVAPIAAATGIEVREIDIDSDRILEERWGDRVPVLLGGEREICHYRLDAPALDAFLNEVAPRRDFG